MNTVFEDSWKEIMELGQFSEQADILLIDGNEVVVSGIFYSGSYLQNSKAPYTSRKWERQDYFQISTYSLPATVLDPIKELRNAQIEVEGRGLFKIHEVKGAQSGMLTLSIQPKEFNRDV